MTTNELKKRQAAAIINKIRGLGDHAEGEELPNRLAKVLSKKLSLDDLSDLLILARGENS